MRQRMERVVALHLVAWYGRMRIRDLNAREDRIGVVVVGDWMMHKVRRCVRETVGGVETLEDAVGLPMDLLLRSGEGATPQANVGG